MPKIKLLFVTNQLGIGGTEKTLQILCKYLDKSKFDVYVCGRLTGGIRQAEIEKYSVPVYIKPPSVDRLIRELKIDIYHVHRAGDYEPGTLPQRKPSGLKIVETNVFGELDMGENYLIDCHIFVSKFCRDRYLRRYCQFHNKCYEVIYNPVDFDEFPIAERKFHCAFGNLNRPDDQKWHELGIRIIPKVIRKVSNARCYLMGATDRVRGLIQSFGVQDHVYYLPPSLDVAAFYNQVDVFTHASKAGESFGCVIAEAMANKIPVVTLNMPQYKKGNAQAELVEDQVNGFVCKTESQYASAVIELLENHRLREKLGEQAYQKAQDCFDAWKIAKKLESLYVALMDTKF